MASPGRSFVNNEYYHVYNRGNHRDSIFHESKDYKRFLWSLHDATAEQGVEVAAYCLMPNHYHLLLKEASEAGIVKAMTSLGITYVKYYNRVYGQVGRLFQERYQARYIRGDTDLLNITAYIHQNPSNLAPVEEYEWSSFRAYTGDSSRFCRPQTVLDTLGLNFTSYATYFQERNIPGVPGDYCVTK